MGDNESRIRSIQFFSTSYSSFRYSPGDKLKQEVINAMIKDAGILDNGTMFVANHQFQLGLVELKGIQRKFKDSNKSDIYEALSSFFGLWISKNSEDSTMGVILDVLKELNWETMEKTLLAKDWETKVEGLVFKNSK